MSIRTAFKVTGAIAKKKQEKKEEENKRNEHKNLIRRHFRALANHLQSSSNSKFLRTKQNKKRNQKNGRNHTIFEQSSFEQ